jgi:hypothetical protein
MAYLSAENAKTYRALLSGGRFGADVEPGEPVAPSTGAGGSYGVPNAPTGGTSSGGGIPATGPSQGPRTTTPPINQPTGYVPRNLPPAKAQPKTIIGKDTFTPKSFSSPGAFQQQEETPKTNFMPLVYIGGAGLLLYYLFKK